MARRTAVLVVVPALLVALAACSDPADDPSGRTTPSTTSEPTTAPTTPGATPTPEPTLTAQPYEITFDVPDGMEVVLPDDVVAGTPEAEALDVYLRYEVAAWVALTTNEIPDELAAVSLGAPLTDIESRVANQTAEDFRLTGSIVTTPQVEAVSDTVAVVTGCVDQSAVMVIDAGTEREPEGGSPTYVFRANLNPGLGENLIVASYEIEETTC